MADKDGTAILLFAHGSSLEEANRALHELARQVEGLGPCQRNLDAGEHVPVIAHMRADAGGDGQWHGVAG